MRTTLDIDDDVLAAAKELARQQGSSAGHVVSMLLRQALTGSGRAAERRSTRRPATSAGGFRPFAARGAPVTNELIDRLRDEEGA